MSKDNVPRLRFPGFSGAWEERKLGEICFIGDIDHRMPPSVSVGIPYVMTGDFIGINDIDFKNAKCVSEDDYEQLSIKIKPEKGDILFARYASVGTVRYVETSQKFLVSYSCAILKPNEEVKGKYLYFYLQTGAAQQRIELEINTGSQRNIGIDSLKNNITISTPEIDEQNQIVAFLTNLDNLITIHQCKLNNLQNLKSGLLQKMFPKDGEDYPEVRFPGFTDAWEWRKLGELGSVVMNKRIFKEQTSETGEVPFYKIGTFGSKPDAFISRELFERYKLIYPYPELGDILISASGSIGRTVEYIGKDEYFQDSNIVWLKHDERLINSFLKQFYSVVKWNGLEGSTIKRLYNKNILDTHIPLPKPKEQSKIGHLFLDLDNLINLHKRKLDHLQEQKKALLQQMFV